MVDVRRTLVDQQRYEKIKAEATDADRALAYIFQLAAFHSDNTSLTERGIAPLYLEMAWYFNRHPELKMRLGSLL